MRAASTPIGVSRSMCARTSDDHRHFLTSVRAGPMVIECHRQLAMLVCGSHQNVPMTWRDGLAVACVRDGSMVIGACRAMCAVCLDTHRRVTQHVGENHRRPSVLPDLCSGWPDGHRMTSATRDACVREPSERLDDFA